MTDPAVLRACLTTDWRRAAYVRFRDGIEIARLRDVPPDVALLRYAPGACVPEHRHEGLEMICVLDGAQSDGRGTCATARTTPRPCARCCATARPCPASALNPLATLLRLAGLVKVP